MKHVSLAADGLPIEENAAFEAAGQPQPVFVYEDGKRTDGREVVEGLPVWKVPVKIPWKGGRSDNVKVSSATEPVLDAGDVVVFDQLIARPWSMGENSGFGLRALGARNVGRVRTEVLLDDETDAELELN